MYFKLKVQNQIGNTMKYSESSFAALDLDHINSAAIKTCAELHYLWESEL
jgi:hypothetical protein